MRVSFLAAISICLIAFATGAQAHGRHHYRHHHYHGSIHHDGGSGNLVARSGARTSVSSVALPHFQCLVNRLENAGYRIDFMGGFASRSNPSAHPTGNAVDINQTAFGRVTRALPSGYVEMADSCGVYSGSHVGDVGHFEMPHKYGYVNIGTRYAVRHRSHYATHHYRHYAKG